MLRRAALATLVAALLPLAAQADGDGPHLALWPTVGLGAGPGTAGRAAVSPRFGLALTALPGPFGARLAWRAGGETAGTSVVSVSQVRHSVVAEAEGRLHLTPTIGFVGGLGGGLVVDLVSDDVLGGTPRDAVVLAPAGAWDAGLDLVVGPVGLRITLGGLLARGEHDLGFDVAVGFTLY